MTMKGTVALALCLLVPLVSNGPSLAAEDEPVSRGPNVLITIEVAYGERTPAQTYQLIAGDREKAHATVGRKVPIAATTFSSKAISDGAIVPITSYTYQNVGFQATFQPKVLDDGRVELEGTIESSFIGGPEAGVGSPGQPTVVTVLQQLGGVVLKPDVPLVLKHLADAKSGPVTLTIKATTMR